MLNLNNISYLFSKRIVINIINTRIFSILYQKKNIILRLNEEVKKTCSYLQDTKVYYIFKKLYFKLSNNTKNSSSE